MKLCFLLLFCAVSLSYETSEEKWELLQKSLTALAEEVEVLKESFTETKLNITRDLNEIVSSYMETNLERIISELQPLKKMNDLEELTRSTCSRIQIDDLRRLVSLDMPQCSPGWILHEKGCYFFSSEQLDWDDGRKECRNKGADYVKITKKTEYDFVKGHLQPPNHYWIGANDKDEEGTYRWISDGEELPYDLTSSWWIPGDPNNGGSNEHCIQFRYYAGSSYLWNDSICGLKTRFICERKAK